MEIYTVKIQGRKAQGVDISYSFSNLPTQRHVAEAIKQEWNSMKHAYPAGGTYHQFYTDAYHSVLRHDNWPVPWPYGVAQTGGPFNESLAFSVTKLHVINN